MESQVENKQRNIIEKFTNYFLKNTRLTLVLIPLLLIGGIFAYHNLKRDGFPPIEIPTVIINTSYFVGDVLKVDRDVTQRIENLVKKIDGVSTYSSSTTENFSTVVVTFKDEISSDEGARLIFQEYQKDKFLGSVQPVITPLKVASRDNKSDMIFSIANPALDTIELQKKASIIAAKLTKLPEIGDAYSIDQIITRINPISQQETQIRESFGRFVVRTADGEFRTYDSISIGVVKENDSLGTLDISRAVRNEIDRLKADGTLEGYEISYNGDFANSLNTQLRSLESNAISAVLIIVVVMFFLINWRSALLLALFFPLTLGGVFIGLTLIGYSLNTITLFALILVLGLFVDDGIIVVEAIDAFKKQGFKGFAAVRQAIKSIGVADWLGTITTVLVFVPLLFISGPLGEFIRQIPATVILSLVISLLVALSILPFVSGVFLQNKSSKRLGLLAKFFQGVENITLKAGEKLGSFVRFYLSSKLYTFIVLILTIAMILGGSFFASKLKFNIFAPSKDSESISISISFEDLTIEQAILKSREVDEVIKLYTDENLKEYEYARGNSSTAIINLNLIPLANRDTTSVEIGELLNKKLNEIEGVKAFVNTSIAGPPADPRPFKMQIFDDSSENLALISENLKNFIFDTELKNTKVNDIQLGDLNVFSKKEGRRYLQVEVGFDEGATSATISELQNLIKQNWIPEIIQEKDLELSESSFGFDSGFASSNAESFSSLSAAFTLSLLAMYVLLMVQFNSFTQPFLILLSVPFSFVLLFPGLYLTNNDLSFFVTVGLTALIGIVVNNSIVLLEYTNQLRDEGMGISNSISKAIEQRFRPILSTTVTSIAGLLPLALSDPFWEPLAFTIIFGLTSSVIFVLVSYPAFFAVFEKIRTSKRRLIVRFVEV